MEEYISHATATLLKECGFPQNCPPHDVTYYDENGRIGYKQGNCYTDRPTQSSARRWLREKRRLNVSVDMGFYDWNGVNGLHWDYKLIRLGNTRLFYLDVEINAFHTYEEAAEAGIKAACEYLIKNKR